MGDAFARAMAVMDREETVKILAQILADATKPPTARASSARALAQMPAHRQVAVRLAIESGKMSVVGAFMQGLRFGRLDYVERSRAADASTDPSFRLAYNRERLKDMEVAFEYLGEIRANLDEAQAKATKLPDYLDMFNQSIREARQSIRQMELAQKGD